MTEARYVTLIPGFVATSATALVTLLINNSRLSDTRQALQAEMDSKLAMSRGIMASGREAILSQMATYQNGHPLEIAELDNRITRFEP